MLFGKLLAGLITKGRLTVVDADGRTHVFGTDAEPSVTLRLHDRSLHWRLFFRAPVVLGEAYMDGTLTVENGQIEDAIAIFFINMGPGGTLPGRAFLARARRYMREFDQFNPITRAKRNVAHHYDLSDELYSCFLDADRQYSCAYFRSADDSLERAQAQKKRHIAAKLQLSPGSRVLDIGSGWGGLAIYLAESAKADVTGITLSSEQYKVATERAALRGLTEHAHFLLRDYREITGRFDRIVSVGMFEHVGVGFYKTFLRKLAALLNDDGVALLHTIGRSDGPGATAPWIKKYIFPGGYAPALSEVLPIIEQSGLIVTDIEVLRLHYAETLKAWRARFRAHWDDMAALYDARFCRMWEFYLASSEMAFRHQGLVVYQIQLTKRIDTLPLTRDYIAEHERPLEHDCENRLRDENLRRLYS